MVLRACNGGGGAKAPKERLGGECVYVCVYGCVCEEERILWF